MFTMPLITGTVYQVQLGTVSTFVLLKDTWSQQGHSVSCMTILFLNLQITRSDIRPHIKWAVSLVIAYGHFNLPQGFVWVCMSSHTHFITPKGTDDTADETHFILFFSKCFRNVFYANKEIIFTPRMLKFGDLTWKVMT